VFYLAFARNFDLCFLRLLLCVSLQSVIETLRSVSPSLLRQLAPMIEQLAPMYLDLAQGRQVRGH
jgi:hypothetical protein